MASVSFDVSVHVSELYKRSRGRKRLLFSQTVSNTLLDMDSTPAKNARMFTTPRKVVATSSGGESSNEKDSEVEKEKAASADKDQQEDGADKNQKLPQFQILALSSEEESEEDIFSHNSVDASKLPGVSIVNESATDSENEKLEETPKKSPPKQKKANRNSVSNSTTR